MNNKGNILDIIGMPIFSIAVLGLVFISTAGAIAAIGESTTYEKKLHSANIALFIDALQATARELTITAEYSLPKFHADIQPYEVTVYEDAKDDGLNFFYTINPFYGINPQLLGKTKLEQSNHRFVARKQGRTINFEATPLEAQDGVYCPHVAFTISDARVLPSHLGERLVLQSQALSYAEKPYTNTDLLIGFMHSEGIRIYTQNDPESISFGCKIMQSIIERHPFSQINVIPTNPNVMHPSDPRRNLYFGTHALIIGTEQRYETRALEGVRAALRQYGVE